MRTNSNVLVFVSIMGAFLACKSQTATSATAQESASDGDESATVYATANPSSPGFAAKCLVSETTAKSDDGLFSATLQVSGSVRAIANSTVAVQAENAQSRMNNPNPSVEFSVLTSRTTDPVVQNFVGLPGGGGEYVPRAFRLNYVLQFSKSHGPKQQMRAVVAKSTSASLEICKVRFNESNDTWAVVIQGIADVDGGPSAPLHGTAGGDGGQHP